MMPLGWLRALGRQLDRDPHTFGDPQTSRNVYALAAYLVGFAGPDGAGITVSTSRCTKALGWHNHRDTVRDQLDALTSAGWLVTVRDQAGRRPAERRLAAPAGAVIAAVDAATSKEAPTVTAAVDAATSPTVTAAVDAATNPVIAAVEGPPTSLLGGGGGGERHSAPGLAAGGTASPNFVAGNVDDDELEAFPATVTDADAHTVAGRGRAHGELRTPADVEWLADAIRWAQDHQHRRGYDVAAKETAAGAPDVWQNVARLRAGGWTAAAAGDAMTDLPEKIRGRAAAVILRKLDRLPDVPDRDDPTNTDPALVAVSAEAVADVWRRFNLTAPDDTNTHHADARTGTAGALLAAELEAVGLVELRPWFVDDTGAPVSQMKRKTRGLADELAAAGATVAHLDRLAAFLAGLPALAKRRHILDQFPKSLLIDQEAPA